MTQKYLLEQIAKRDDRIGTMYTEPEVREIIGKVLRDAAGRAEPGETLCRVAIDRRREDQSSCGKWCGACDAPIATVDKSSITSTPFDQYLKK